MSDQKRAVGRRTLLTTMGRRGLTLGLTATLAGLGANPAQPAHVMAAVPQGDPATVTIASGIGQPNHVIADDTHVYWTELTSKRAFIRKAPRAGGPATTLYSEPSEDSRGLRVAQVQLKQNSTTLFWSRQTVGYYQHWSIITIPKAGGTVRAVLREDASVIPMYASKWAVTETYVAALIAAPAQLRLPRKTVIAKFDLATRTWTTLLAGRLAVTRTSILAATEDAVYVRGLDTDEDTEIGKVSLDGDYTLLASSGVVDRAIDEPAATDGTNLYYWSRTSGSTYRLRSLPVTGGTPSTLYSGPLGKGLAVQGTDLFWAQGGKILQGTTTGTAPVTVATSVLEIATLGGLSVDATSLVHGVRRTRTRFDIRLVTR